jgi:hypothetical protein
MVYNKGFVYSLIMYADKHQGQFPTNLEVAAPFRPADVRAETNLLAEQFELLYQGKLDDLTNPVNTIVVREKEPWLNAKGEWMKTYGFGDGHSEAHPATNNDFAAWETERLPKNSFRLPSDH